MNPNIKLINKDHFNNNLDHYLLFNLILIQKPFNKNNQILLCLCNQRQLQIITISNKMKTSFHQRYKMLTVKRNNNGK